MRLAELAATTQTSPATIKYYLREGLLPAGRAVNARLAEYDERHVRRLLLIGALRGVLGAPIDRIADLLRRVDDPSVPLPTLLGHAQLLALALPDDEPEPAGEPPAITRLLHDRGWETSSPVRAALASHAASMSTLGVGVTEQILQVYADAADSVARLDLANVGATTSRDEAVLVTAVGVHSFGLLLLRLVAVAQAAHATQPGPPGYPAGGSPQAHSTFADGAAIRLTGRCPSRSRTAPRWPAPRAGPRPAPPARPRSGRRAGHRCRPARCMNLAAHPQWPRRAAAGPPPPRSAP